MSQPTLASERERLLHAFYFVALSSPAVVLKGVKLNRPLQALEKEIDSFVALYDVLVVVETAAIPHSLKFIMYDKASVLGAVQHDADFFKSERFPDAKLEVVETIPAYWAKHENLFHGLPDRRRWVLDELTPGHAKFDPQPFLDSLPEVMDHWNAITLLFPGFEAQGLYPVPRHDVPIRDDTITQYDTGYERNTSPSE